MKTCRALLAVAVPLVLGGCVGVPALYQVPPSSPSLDDMMEKARKIENDYADDYKKSATSANFAQLPIIGAAAGAASIILHRQAHASTTVGYIGIGAGAYSAIQSIFFSNNDATLYLSGYGAMGCIRAESFHFVAATKPQHDLYMSQALDLGIDLNNDTVLASQALSSTASTTQKSMFAAATKLLGDAIASATTTVKVANTSLGAYSNAPSVFDSSISAVTIKVASKGRQGKALDFETLQKSFSASIGAAPAAAPNAAQLAAVGLLVAIAPGAAPPVAPSDDQLIQSVLNAAAALNSKNALVELHAFDYSASLGRVAACPNSI